MLNRILILVSCFLACNTLQAKDNTFKPVPLWEALFGKKPLIPLKKHHQDMSDRIFSVIDPKEEKWKIYGTYPADRTEENLFRTSFYLVPVDFDTSYDLDRYCDERLTVDITRYDIPMPLESVMERVKNLSFTRTPFADLTDHTISQQTSNSFIHEKSLKKTDRIPNTIAGYLFGKVIKINENVYHNYTYYQRHKPISEAQKEELLTQFQQIAEALQNPNFKRKK